MAEIKIERNPDDARLQQLGVKTPGFLISFPGLNQSPGLEIGQGDFFFTGMQENSFTEIGEVGDGRGERGIVTMNQAADMGMMTGGPVVFHKGIFEAQFTAGASSLRVIESDFQDAVKIRGIVVRDFHFPGQSTVLECVVYRQG